MSILIAIVIGLFVGIVAKALMPGKDPGGWVITTLLGVGGAVLASFLGRTLGWYNEHQPAGFIGAVLGAVILLLIYRLLRGSHSGTSNLSP